jgi:hypothetical protein
MNTSEDAKMLAYLIKPHLNLSHLVKRYFTLMLSDDMNHLYQAQELKKAIEESINFCTNTEPTIIQHIKNLS